MHNRGVRTTGPPYSQASHYWTRYWGDGRLVFEKGVTRHMEAGIDY